MAEAWGTAVLARGTIVDVDFFPDKPLGDARERAEAVCHRMNSEALAERGVTWAVVRIEVIDQPIPVTAHRTKNAGVIRRDSDEERRSTYLECGADVCGWESILWDVQRGENGWEPSDAEAVERARRASDAALAHEAEPGVRHRG